MGAYEGKTITVKEFRELGYVQEINRRFLHPLGLALEVIVDENGDERIERIWDDRDDPEGWVFAPGLMDAKKAKLIDSEFEKRAHARMTGLGFVRQPVE